MATHSTTDRILDVAQSLLAERGYNGFSFADISDIVGVRKASIHHHFATKAALAARVLARYRRNVREMIATLSAAAPSPHAQIRAFIDYWAQCIADSSMPFCVCALLASEIPTLPDEVAAEVRGHFADLSRALAAALAEGERLGELRLASPAALEADLFMATIHGAMLTARALRRPESFPEIADEALRRISAAS
jgi:TetR/AcrR family transcriptional repressor of nem operon